jgi:hypothetical protein
MLKNITKNTDPKDPKPDTKNTTKTDDKAEVVELK